MGPFQLEVETDKKKKKKKDIETVKQLQLT